MNARTTLTRSTLAAIAIALGGLSVAAHAAGAGATLPTVSIEGDAVAARVTQAVRDAVGDTSPDITVTHQQGEVSLGGWARNSVEVDKAVAVASNVSGVKQVYANGVRLWSTNNYGQ